MALSVDEVSIGYGSRGRQLEPWHTLTKTFAGINNPDGKRIKVRGYDGDTYNLLAPTPKQTR
jgi:hypothetical protein